MKEILRKNTSLLRDFLSVQIIRGKGVLGDNYKSSLARIRAQIKINEDLIEILEKKS